MLVLACKLVASQRYALHSLAQKTDLLMFTELDMQRFTPVSPAQKCAALCAFGACCAVLRSPVTKTDSALLAISARLKA